MTEHLPECVDNDKVLWTVAMPGPVHYQLKGCICDRLRACEQRVLDDDVLAAAYHGQKGYERGLEVARDAVAAEAKARHVDGPTMFLTLPQALAAIDALRGEQ